MKIVHVANRLDPGGAEKQLKELVRRSSLRNEVIQLGVDTSNARTRALADLHRLLYRHRPNVIVAWLDRPQLAVAAVAHGRVTTIANVRGLPRRETPLGRAVFRAALARYDRLVANSHASRAVLRRFAWPFSLGPFEVIPNGVSEWLDLRSGRAPSDSFRLAFIGRADRAKGLDVLLDALEGLERHPVEATLVGASVPEAVRDRFGSNARWQSIPRVTDPWGAVADADVLVVPSRSEGSPNVVLEAFARGVPVIATAVGGIPELVGSDRGLLVPPDDPDELASAILAVAADRVGAAHRCERAATYVHRAHAWPRVVAAYDNLFRRLADT